MRPILYFGSILFSFLLACGNKSPGQDKEIHSNLSEDSHDVIQEETINPDGHILLTRFIPPQGFQRTELTDNSFAGYLRHLPLRAHNSEVMFYDGRRKPNYGIYDGVVDLDIGTRDLHQCADAIMRLRAEYLWSKKQFDRIHFNFTSGFRCDYTEWMKGKRIVLNGNNASWVQTADPVLLHLRRHFDGSC